MDAKIAVEDMTHETYWRQLMRWLVDGVPDQVELTTHARSGRAGRAGHAHRRGVRPRLPRSERRRRQRARHRAERASSSTCRCSGPASATASTAARSRRPRTACTRRASRRRAAARRSARTSAHVRVAPSDSEYFDAAMRAPLLRRISEETGGVYYTPQTVSSLADDVKYTGPRRDDRGRARLVGHADRAVPAAQRDAGRVELSAGAASGIRRYGLPSTVTADGADG